MDELKTMVVALTRMADAATMYLNRASGEAYAPLKENEKRTGVDFTKSVLIVDPDAPAPAKRTRKHKAELTAAPAPETSDGVAKEVAAPAPVLNGAVEMTETESRDLLVKLATEFIMADQDPASQLKRQQTALDHLKVTYKVGSVKDLPHTQRVQFIAWLRGAMPKVVPTRATVGLGL